MSIAVVFSMQKQKQDMEKVRKHLSPEEVGCMLSDLSQEEQHQVLQQQYEQVLETYQRIVDRLERT